MVGMLQLELMAEVTFAWHYCSGVTIPLGSYCKFPAGI